MEEKKLGYTIEERFEKDWFWIDVTRYKTKKLAEKALKKKFDEIMKRVRKKFRVVELLSN